MKSSIGNLLQITLAISIGTLSSLIVLPQSLAWAKPSPSFNCYRKSSGEHVTQIELPSGKKLELISWKRTLSPRSKCDEVSRNFQEFFDSGRLNFIKSGRSYMNVDANGFSRTEKWIICGVAEANASCDNSTKIFDLLPAGIIAETLLKLMRNSDSLDGIVDQTGNPA